MELMSIIIGCLIGAGVLLFIGVIVFAFWFLHKSQYKFKVKITNVSEGRATIAILDCKLGQSPTLGQVLESNRLKSITGMDKIPYFGTSSTYPLSGGFAKWYVPLS